MRGAHTLPGSAAMYTEGTASRPLTAQGPLNMRVDEKEGRQLQALVDEALADLIEKHKNAQPRPLVMGAYLASHEKYGPLYKKLAG